MRLVSLGYVGKVLGASYLSGTLCDEVNDTDRPITSDNEDLRIHCQVFAIPTTHIQSYRAVRQPEEKSLDDRP